MKLDHEGRRETFPPDAPNQTAAVTRARDIYPLLAFRKILEGIQEGNGMVDEKTLSLSTSKGVSNAFVKSWKGRTAASAARTRKQ